MIIDYHVSLSKKGRIPLRQTKKKWTIVGGGLHGIHLAATLIHQGVKPDEMVVVDRYPKPLHLWTLRTHKLEMGYLRSSGVHHLDVSPWSLMNYGEKHYGNPKNWCSKPYQRPAYSAFQQHCQRVIEDNALQTAFYQAEALSISKKTEGYRLETTRGHFQTEYLALALGQAEVHRPAWAETCLHHKIRVHHLLDDDFPADLEGEVVVVGGGMTGCQYALAQSCRQRVTLVRPSGLVDVSDFDADPCWIGPACLNDTFRAKSLPQRRELISSQRRKGSINPQVREALSEAVRAGRIKLISDRVVALHDGMLQTAQGHPIPCETLVLATGFKAGVPSVKFFESIVESLSLPLSPCGFPLVSDSLEWIPKLFVMGSLAELVLGPVSRNITGARSAAKLIASASVSLLRTSPKERIGGFAEGIPTEGDYGVR